MLRRIRSRKKAVNNHLGKKNTIYRVHFTKQHIPSATEHNIGKSRGVGRYQREGKILAKKRMEMNKS